MTPPTTESEAAPAVRARCHDCGLLHRIHELAAGLHARCPRCGAVVRSHKPDSIERSLALYVAALVLWIVANSFRFMTLEMQGRRQPTLLASGAWSLYDDGLWELAVLVFVLVIAFPLAKIVASLAVLVPLHLGRRPRYLRRLFRAVDLVHPWAMTEVFLLGVLVAYAKLLDLAHIEIGPSLIAFVGLMLTLVAATGALDRHEVWERIEPAPPLPAVPRAHLVACHACHRLEVMSAARTGRCGRCDTPLHPRKRDSLHRTWALVLAALILYVPANIYPVMTVISFGRGDPSTIVGGVRELLAEGMWPLALLVLFASITVPVLKLGGLIYLLLSVQSGSRWRPRQRTAMYRVVEAVGRWSMIDIFMLSILVALVRLGSIATIQPGIGAISFAAVVVLTMFAAMTFDPRLIWDAAGANDERE